MTSSLHCFAYSTSSRRDSRPSVTASELPMQAMILAAGRGERMRPLSDRLPKPLLEAGGKSLLAWQIERLAGAGFRDIVMNVAYLRHAIEAAVGDGSRFGVTVRYSRETEPLEVAGGIATALPLLT